MRNGLLVEEESPREILFKYSTNTLEAAFLALCCNQKMIKVLPLDVFYFYCIIYVYILTYILLYVITVTNLFITNFNYFIIYWLNEKYFY